jgi:cell division protein FtsW (lipid II flippase)
MHIQNSESNIGNDEVIKKDKIINILLIIGFIVDLIDYLLITSQTLAPEYLHEFYSEHKFLIQIIYLFGGFILIGIFFVKMSYKLNFKNKINEIFNQVEVK